MLGCLRTAPRILRRQAGVLTLSGKRAIRSLSVAKEEPVHYDTKVSTPIYYVNGEPHIGHIYSSALADAVVRWDVVQGRSAYMTTGTDEHGQKVQKEAEKRRIDVKQYCDSVASSFQEELSHYSLSIGRFIRTTDVDHVSLVKRVWQQLMESGDLYEADYTGYYCRSDEAFLTAKQVCEKDGRMVCKDNGNAVELVKERNWMFRLQKYKPQLLSFLQSHPEWITPSSFQQDVVRMIEESTQDLSVSRPLARVPWSIPVDASTGVYVWLDALTNYLTTSEGRSFGRVVHVFGKDILKFHGYFYPCLLMALHQPLPSQMVCHNHWTVNGAKISKSKGNYVPLRKLREFVPGELIRGYLLTEDTLVRDGDFDTEHLLHMTRDLADVYGNLLMRSLGKAIATPVLGKAIATSTPPKETQIELTPVPESTTLRLQQLVEGVKKHYDAFAFCDGYKLIMNELKAMNLFFNEQHPWTLANDTKDTKNMQHLASVLMEVWESLRVCSVLLQPIIPSYATRALHLLNPSYSATQITTLAAIQNQPLDVRTMVCCSDRLFTKLSKAEEARVLKL